MQREIARLERRIARLEAERDRWSQSRHPGAPGKVRLIDRHISYYRACIEALREGKPKPDRFQPPPR